MTSRKIEDFDEFCDPKNPKEVKIEDVKLAAKMLKPHVRNVPLMTSFNAKKFGIHLSYKLETFHSSGSFKERGAFYTLDKLPLDKKKLGVVVASLANEGIAMSYCAAKLDISIVVVLPTTVPITFVERCNALGARTCIEGANLQEAMRFARGLARDNGLTYINSRDHPDMLAGYGTVALEILEECPAVEAIIIPIGSGGLAAAVATVVKKIKPDCLLYGVQPEATPLFMKTLENESADETTKLPEVKANNGLTIANSLKVDELGINSAHTIKATLDKMLLVKENWIAQAMLHMYERQKVVVEGAAACTLAVIIGRQVPELKGKHVIAIMSGGTVDPLSYCRSLERGLTAEGQMIKLRVYVDDNTQAVTQLLRLIAKGGYPMHRSCQSRRWLDDDTYKVEVILVYRAKNLEHALELKRIVERAYPCLSVFETEPFNDKRTCPCYVYKKVCPY